MAASEQAKTFPNSPLENFGTASLYAGSLPETEPDVVRQTHRSIMLGVSFTSTIGTVGKKELSPRKPYKTMLTSRLLTYRNAGSSGAIAKPTAFTVARFQ
jgi:hypothetical protein